MTIYDISPRPSCQLPRQHRGFGKRVIECFFLIVLVKVPDAIQDLNGGGIKVCMVTGDNLSSAAAFGFKSGLLSPTKEWTYYGCDSKVLNNVSCIYQNEASSGTMGF